MNYDNDPDFNKARTREESFQTFADRREAMYNKANADFGGGVQDGLVYFTIGAAMFLLLLAATA